MTARSWRTADEIVRAGTPAEAVRCSLCGERVWDGEYGRHSAPACAPCRATNSEQLAIAIAIVRRDLIDERESA